MPLGTMKLRYPPEWFRRLDCGDAGSTIGCYSWLAALADRYASGGRLLEIGTHWGAGTVALALGAGQGARIDTVDCIPRIAGDLGVWERRFKNWQHVPDANIVFHLGSAATVVPGLAGPWGLVLIDASHDWALKGQDWENVRARARVVVFDDLVPDWPFYIEAKVDGWREVRDEDLVAACFPGGHSEAWSGGRAINSGCPPKFGVLLAPP